MSLLSLCVIAKDEEEDLPRLLSSVRGVVDEIILVDTGSTDRTVEIARGFGAKVCFFPWTGDFSEARNFSLDQATGDWIIFLDADEELAEGEGEKLRQILNAGTADAYSVIVVNFVGEREGVDAVLNPSVRIFRNRPEYRFRGSIHEQIGPVIQEHGGKIEYTNIKINHYGYLSNSVRGKRKVARNLALLEKAVRENPEDSFNRFNLGVEYLRRRDFLKALREFQTAFKYLPDLAVSHASILVRNIALCLEVLGRYEEALKVLADAKEVYPDYTDLWFLEGCVHLDRGDLARARASFKECLARGESAVHFITQRGVGSYLAWHLLGQVEEREGNRDQAISAYRRAWSCQRKFYPALDRLVRLTLTRGPGEASRTLLNEVDPKDEEACLVVARALADADCHVEAVEFLKGALAHNPSSSRLALAMAWALLRLKRYTEAAEVLSGFQHPEVRLRRSFILALQGKVREARKLIESLPESYALCCRIYSSFIACLAGKAEAPLPLPDEEEEVLRTVLELLSTLLELEAFDEFEKTLPLLDFLPEPRRRMELGKLLYRHGFAELAAEEIIAAVQGGARDAEGFVVLGKVAADKGFHEEAVVFYQQALEGGKGDFSWYTALIKELTFLGRYEEAAEVAREGLKAFPRNELLQSLLSLLQKMESFAEVKEGARGEDRRLS
ncbi:TPR domain-containing glycosyltransferase [Ammonifex thiophilus]|uniref:TPR domain-containing glycosyltransferase n=1 Tax=Ammonifex thiophilus TaxID=444093 RepID=UPI0014032232|nr:TPR domain-containing glycosyltransferase [Ammonifex thiophilus]